MAMTKVRSGVTLHHLTAGEGPDVVMLHGFLGNLAAWHLQILPKLKNDFRVTTYDLRGHGHSEQPATGYTASDMADDLLGLIDALGMDKVQLVGHSFGADVCLYFAYRYPDRVERVAALEPGLAALVDQRKDPSWIGWDYWASKLEEVGLTVPPDKRTDLQYLFDLSVSTPKFYGPARGLPRKRESILKLIRETSLIADYEVVGELTLDAIRTIETETLLVYGDKSHFLGTLEVLQQLLPNHSTALLPGGEHFGPLEQPLALVEALRSFLRMDPRTGSQDEATAAGEESRATHA